MTEISPLFLEQLNNRIGEEFDWQMQERSPFKLIRNTFNDFKDGPIILALGAVGGGGAGEKAKGILEQFEINKTPYVVVAMRKYLEANSSIVSFLKENKIDFLIVEDRVAVPRLYQNCIDALMYVKNQNRPCGVLSLGPRTYYPEAARRLGLPAMIIDGAVPDKWSDKTESSDLPVTEYYLPSYLETIYATTCGFTGWFPPKDRYPEGMRLEVVAQPFSQDKIQFLRNLRNDGPESCRRRVIESGQIKNLDFDGVIIIPTIDQVYLNPMALSVFGRFLTAEQLGQSYGFWAELITSCSLLAKDLDKQILLYVRPGIMKDLLSPLINLFTKEGIKIIEPINGLVPNEEWLLLRKAGVTIGRAPLCVSTAEALGMGDYQITTAIPSRTSDGISYMTEPEALKTLAQRQVSETIFPGYPLIEAIKKIIDVKKL
jgi:hypothetical protein